MAGVFHTFQQGLIELITSAKIMTLNSLPLFEGLN